MLGAAPERADVGLANEVDAIGCDAGIENGDVALHQCGYQVVLGERLRCHGSNSTGSRALADDKATGVSLPLFQEVNPASYIQDAC